MWWIAGVLGVVLIGAGLLVAGAGLYVVKVFGDLMNQNERRL